MAHITSWQRESIEYDVIESYSAAGVGKIEKRSLETFLSIFLRLFLGIYVVSLLLCRTAAFH